MEPGDPALREFYTKWTGSNCCIFCLRWICPMRERVHRIMEHLKECELCTSSEIKEAEDDILNIQLGDALGRSQYSMLTGDDSAGPRAGALGRMGQGGFHPSGFIHGTRMAEEFTEFLDSSRTVEVDGISGFKMGGLVGVEGYTRLLRDARWDISRVPSSALGSDGGIASSVSDAGSGGFQTSLHGIAEEVDTEVSLVDYMPLGDGGVYEAIGSGRLLPPWVLDSAPLMGVVMDERTKRDYAVPKVLSSISPRLAFIPPRITGFMPSIFYQLEGTNLLFLWELDGFNGASIREWWRRGKAVRGPPGLEWALKTLKGLKVVLLNQGDCISIPGGCFWSIMTWDDSFYIRVDFADRAPKTISSIREAWFWLEDNAEDGLFEKDEEEKEGVDDCPSNWAFGETSFEWHSKLTRIFLEQRNMALSLGYGDLYDGYHVEYATPTV
ncbi:hypothetical protein BS47DRAFT_1362068 [Hydnum rufescens UP504]|uniref:JmjC domain-containing protein n=1 Tax=Hydnum rufescens UP504 TaxID=1448309 RepID=A0A9P6AY25_9AGAM|nr:hypothetical protein BS47DRAFT_1362068 [Hydnum rufescens UP504]